MAGEVLKKKREELGLEIKQVADALKLRPEYLNAIEHDLLEKLPVAVYTKGYIREYASFLKVDAGPIIAYYNQHLAQPQPSTIYPVSATRRKTPAVFVILPAGMLLLAAGAFLFFQLRGTGQQTAAPQPVQAPAAVSIPPVQSQPPAAVPALENIPAPPPQAVASTGHRLLVSAHEKAWVQITFSNGKSDEMLMRPGDTKNWEFSETAVLRMGNAGGIRIQIDEGELLVPGAKGQVLSMTLPRP